MRLKQILRIMIVLVVACSPHKEVHATQVRTDATPLTWQNRVTLGAAVLLGTVSDERTRTVRLDQYSSAYAGTESAGKPVDVYVVVLVDVETLKGQKLSDPIVIYYSKWGPFAGQLNRGNRAVVVTHYTESMQQHTIRSLYPVVDGRALVDQNTSEWLELSEIRTFASAVDVPGLSRRAEVIVEGSVTRIAKGMEIDGAAVSRFTLAVKQLFKGDLLDGATIDVLMGERAGRVGVAYPDQNSAVGIIGRAPQVGDQLVLFLCRNSNGFYICSGDAGWMLIQGNDIMRNVIYKYDGGVEGLVSTVKAVVESVD